MNTMMNEAYLQDLSDEKDYKVYYYQRITQEIASMTTSLASLTADTDDYAVAEARIAWMTERQTWMQEEATHATEMYNEEFARRQKQIEEENFYRSQ
jgi:hypothetical protein